MRLLFISDHQEMMERIFDVLIDTSVWSNHFITALKSKDIVWKEYDGFFDNYDIVFSIHCKKIFPAWLVNKRRCINLHPGYNPYNKGMFPHVFSIINGKPIGATLHEIDEKIDHGQIIDQRQIFIWADDTSETLYSRLMDLEIQIFRENIEQIINGKPEKGNLNTKSDFNDLCELDLDKEATYGEVINRLRALTHPPHKNAYFIDGEDRIYVSINLERGS